MLLLVWLLLRIIMRTVVDLQDQGIFQNRLMLFSRRIDLREMMDSKKKPLG
jgi:hypothetical protein